MDDTQATVTSGNDLHHMVTEGALSWRIEETCFNAFPSLRQVLFGNWLLRFADGVTRRVGDRRVLRRRPPAEGARAGLP